MSDDNTFAISSSGSPVLAGTWEFDDGRLTVTGPELFGGPFVYDGVGADGGNVHVSERLHSDSGVFDVAVADEDHVTMTQVSSFEGEAEEPTDINDRMAIVLDCSR